LIISRTPLRVSFLGGGTDFPEFYNEHGGAVLSSAIDKYIYVVVKKRFDDKIVLHYTQTETLDSVDDIQHDIIRESMKLVGVEKGIEITTLADIPSEGTGLGSSSSLAVGLLHALYTYLGINDIPPEVLAEDACKVEIDIMGKAMGKQDAYIASLGGLRVIEFAKDSIQTFHFRRRIRRALEGNLMLFYTGITRQATEILVDVKASIPDKTETLTKLMNLCYRGKTAIEGGTNNFGDLLNQNWSLKKALADTVSNELIDELYARSIVSGASGGKICGAGGGGFLLLYCVEDRQDVVRERLSDYRELEFSLEDEGSKIIYQEK